MKSDTRSACFGLLILVGFILGCSSDDGTSSDNQPPTVSITAHPADSIFFTQSADFTWQGTDSDGTITGYYAGLDGDFVFTTRTDTSYSGFTLGDVLEFEVIAVDNDGALSDTASYPFNIYPYSPIPEVEIVSGPADSIFANETAVFVWQGSDPDGDIIGYHISWDGDWSFTTDTTISYDANNSDFSLGSSHTFQVAAEDAEGAFSDTAEWNFDIVSSEIVLYAFGEGTNDEDGDFYWMGYAIRWSPQITVWESEVVKLFVEMQPTYGVGTQWDTTTGLITRNPGEKDTLTIDLPIFPKNYYDFQLQLQESDGSLIIEIPYGSVTSLTSVGLEELEGFHAWFDSVWVINEIDTIPAGSPDGYYEAIDLWWDVDAYPDAGIVKVVVHERNSSNVETNVWPYYPYEVDGLGDEDARGFHINAALTNDTYDYKLVLFDQNDVFLNEIDYEDEEFPELTDVPLGRSGVPVP